MQTLCWCWAGHTTPKGPDHPACPQLVTHHPCPLPCLLPVHEQAPQERVFHAISHHGSRGAGQPVPAVPLPVHGLWENKAPALARKLPGRAESSLPEKAPTELAVPSPAFPFLSSSASRREDAPSSSSFSLSACVFSYGASKSTELVLDGGAKPGAVTRQRGRPPSGVCPSSGQFPLQPSVSEKVSRKGFSPRPPKPRGRRLSLHWAWEESSSSREEEEAPKVPVFLLEGSLQVKLREGKRVCKGPPWAEKGEVLECLKPLHIPRPSLPHSSPCEPGTLPTRALPPFLSGAAPQPVMPGDFFHPAAYTGSILPAGYKAGNGERDAS